MDATTPCTDPAASTAPPPQGNVLTELTPFERRFVLRQRGVEVLGRLMLTAIMPHVSLRPAASRGCSGRQGARPGARHRNYCGVADCALTAGTLCPPALRSGTRATLTCAAATLG